MSLRNVFTILAFLDFFVFLLRGLKTLRAQFFSRFFLSLACICAALILMPAHNPKLTEFFAGLIIICLSLAILADIFLAAFLKFKESFLGGKGSSIPLPQYLMEVCKSMESLAGKKTGALIILERKDNLEAYTGSGVFFDAQVKAEAISALFAHESPVHDGAAIIANGRIKKVRTILPLRTQASVPLGIGTRHRSAIGITEKTDAIALVVSEERGEISVAYRGYLAKVASPKELYATINAALKGKNISPVKISA